MIITDKYEIIRSTDFVKCVSYACKPNPKADLDDEDLENLSGIDGEEIPIYINQPLEAKVEYDGQEYKAYGRQQNTRMPWELIGVVKPTQFLPIALERCISQQIEFAGGSVLHVYSDNKARKRFIPFTFTYKITYDL